MRVIVLGPPGSDRETTAAAVAARLGVPTISLRQSFEGGLRAQNSTALRAKRYMETGQLVPDRLMLSMIWDRLGQPDTAAGFLLDGLPNDWVPAAQVDAMLADLGTAIDRVIDLVLTDAEVVRRLSGRRTCGGCGRLWHVEFDPPARPEACDYCAGELFQRPQDHADRISGGLLSYRPAVVPTLDHYRSLGRLVSVDATLTAAEIVDRAVATA